MKKLRKIACTLLVLAMVFVLAAPAFAAAPQPPTTTITFPANTGRTFDGFLLLHGSSDGTNFAYRVNEKYKSILVAALGMTGNPDSEDIVAEIANYADKSVDLQLLADKVYDAIIAANLTPDVDDFTPTSTNNNSTKVEQGYWMFSDVTQLTGNELAYLIVLDTAGNSTTNINIKPGEISTEKKLDDENDSIKKQTGIDNDEDDLVWQDIADYDIGDSVPFRIHVTLPANTAYFPYYAILMSDTVSEGLTFNGDFKVYVDGVEKTVAKVGADNANEAKFLYEYGGSDNKTVYIYPNYGYKLNTKNEPASASNTNGGDVLPLFDKASKTYIDDVGGAEIVVRYTCTLNDKARVGELGNPNDYTLKFTRSPYDDAFGELKDTVIVLTWNYVVNKVDQNNNALTGADFELYKFIPKATDSQPTAQPTDTTNLKLISTENGTNNYYYKHPYTQQWGVYEKVDRKLVNTEGTTFTFKGLDDGFYCLEETAVPNGYNGLNGNTEFRIWAGHVTELDSNRTIFDDTHKFEYRVPATSVLPAGTVASASGVISSTIQNKTGTELPSTGGIGTTIFYVLGIVMVLGAAVLLITNKRMRSAK